MNSPTLSIRKLLGATAVTALATAALLAIGTAGADHSNGKHSTATTTLSR